MVDLLALAHERGCEAGLAEHLQALLARGELPDPTELRRRFAPDPGALPVIEVPLASLTSYDDLMPVAGGAA